MSDNTLEGNLLVAQSGGPTSVINASLAGVVSEALNHGCIEDIYGGLNGILGILKEEFVDLARELQQTIRGLGITPGSALGTCRFKLKKKEDYERILNIFEAHNIRYFLYIGGNDSQDSADKIAQLATEKGYALRTIGIPKTIDNDLPVTDHCPGYGSAIKYIATTVREIALDNQAMGQHDLVSIVEVMGRNAGWITAGAALAKDRNKPEQAPHILCLPEKPFVLEKFLQRIQSVLKTQKYCMVVVGEGLIGPDGTYIGIQSTTSTDAFGHVQLGGVSDYLANSVTQHLGVKVRSAKLGYAQRAAAHCGSKTDNNEAFLCGQTAVRAAVEGETGKMVSLIRSESGTYQCEIGLAPLNEVANGVKTIPENWIEEEGFDVNYQFYKYALPLIQGEVSIPYENGTPAFVRLDAHRVGKKLEPYTPYG